MDDIASITRRIARLKRMVKEYFALPDGAIIERHVELLRVFDIRGSIHSKQHPHHMMRVYISRKSLKHFVESRKAELERNHTSEEALWAICIAIDSIQEVITDFTLYTFEPGSEVSKHFYFKDYSYVGKPAMRILLELKEGRLEIFSIHFTKNKKVHKNSTD